MGNPVVHFEIGCRDLEKTAAFYTEMFGWQGSPMGPAVMIDTQSGTGVPGHITALGHEPHNYTHFYVQVDNLEAALQKIGELGGATVIPPVPLPTGRFAWFSDPEGNTVGLFEVAK